MAQVPSGPRVSAVLGPTNTGKTHLAIERMLGHASGMIGFPLRLLARENYDRVVRLKGVHQARLVTGEEKIVPPTARYFCCTVESMPLDRPVEFLAVDEIQLAADPERGHVFTDRLLHARGIGETMLLGADTIRPLLRRLVPEAEIVTRPRFSTLTYAGPKKITRLPRRSAVVAFSADEVYAIAELLRRQRGGTAVVMGALEPAHAQRPGRALPVGRGRLSGRHRRDRHGPQHGHRPCRLRRTREVRRRGTAPPDAGGDGADRRPRRAPHERRHVRRHRRRGAARSRAGRAIGGAPVRHAARAALAQRRSRFFLAARAARLARCAAADVGSDPARDADDQMALAQMVGDPDCAVHADSPEAVRLLWDVCQIPDFRKTMADVHVRLLKRIWLHLRGPEGRIPADWAADQMARLDRVEGDIDTLTTRIAHVRTWTYISHSAGWMDDARHWQERARAIEDRLSDALHDRLTQRFVDRRTAGLTRLRDKERLETYVAATGEVEVEGHYVGRLDGFRFAPDITASGDDKRALLAAANRALTGEIAARVRALVESGDDDFTLAEDGKLSWRGSVVARLTRGPRALSPAVDVLDSAFLSTADRETIRRRIAAWMDAQLGRALGALTDLERAALSGPARGLAYQLVEALGTIARGRALEAAGQLARADRLALRACGVRIGFATLYLPALLKPAGVRLRAILWSVWMGEPSRSPPAPGLVTVKLAERADENFYEAVGYPVIAGRAVRADMLERIDGLLRLASRNNEAPPVPQIMSLAGLSAAEAAALIAGMRRRAPRRAKNKGARKDGAFSKLRELGLT